MTQIIGQEKQSLDDLAHHGVKGMKWGVTREGGGRRRATTDEILNARANHNARISKIISADQNVRLATTERGKQSALKVVEKYGKEIAKTDDARIASMYTTGERAANAIVLGPLGLLINRQNTKATSVERFH